LIRRHFLIITSLIRAYSYNDIDYSEFVSAIEEIRPSVRQEDLYQLDQMIADITN
jgi:hypothetical protein